MMARTKRSRRSYGAGDWGRAKRQADQFAAVHMFLRFFGRNRDPATLSQRDWDRLNPGPGEAPVLPAPRNPLEVVGAARLRAWWQKAQILAGLEPKPGRGWHSLRRKFASELMDQPLKVLCQLGGWKTAKTVLRCYQRADEGQLRKALEDRRRARNGNRE